MLQDDEEVAAAEMPAETLKDMAELFADRPGQSPDATHSIGVNFIMSPVKINAPCIFRVRATADGVLIKGLAIKVTSKDGQQYEAIKGVVENKAVTKKRSRSAG
ncbi:MAG TPA: hypothetical protein DEO93_03830 [Stenotrophomonas sp.]|nr:hypothetical protein [Stenotrophomonas sp.]